MTNNSETGFKGQKSTNKSWSKVAALHDTLNVDVSDDSFAGQLPLLSLLLLLWKQYETATIKTNK